MTSPWTTRAAAGLALAAALAPVAALEAADAAPPSGEWNFQVLLDGEPIGEHRFRLDVDGELGRLTSEARFDVKVLGFSAYRYRHRAVERWRGACLASIVATTDDNGKLSQVRLVAADDAPSGLRRAADVPALDDCVMSFAYWHPAMRTQSRLLNAQTGRVEAVQVSRLPDARIDVRGEAVAAQGVRVAGASRPVDVWYAPDGRWIGLDAVVGGGRTLSYRLR